MIITSVFNRIKKDLLILLQSKRNLFFWFIATMPTRYRIKKSNFWCKTKIEMSSEELVKNKKWILLCCRDSFDEKVHPTYWHFNYYADEKNKIGKNNNTIKYAVAFFLFVRTLLRSVFWCSLLFFTTIFSMEPRWSSPLCQQNTKIFCAKKSRRKRTIDYMNRCCDHSLSRQ
jgi:hypothetical protein